jgi:hypothetical protein
MDISSSYRELGPTPPSTYSEQPTRRLPNPRIVKIVSELGLRYRPLTSADQEAHAAQVALLATDLADLDPTQLTRAAQEWALRERFMPKAADLRAMISRSRGNRTPKDPQACCDFVNARDAALLERAGLRWVVSGDKDRPVILVTA